MPILDPLPQKMLAVESRYEPIEIAQERTTERIKLAIQLVDLCWLVALTILKNISQWEGLSYILRKIKKGLKPPTR